MKKYDVYLFDFDGTLFNTFPALERIFTLAYQAVGIHIKPSEVALLSREPLKVSYKRLGGDENLLPLYFSKIDEYLDDEESIKNSFLYDETLEVLDTLIKNGATLGVVTSNKSFHVESILKYHHIEKSIFKAIVGSQEERRTKPEPYPILKALDILNSYEQKVCYVGDGMNDMISANAAKVDAILIDRNNEFNDSNDYLKIKSLKELIK